MKRIAVMLIAIALFTFNTTVSSLGLKGTAGELNPEFQKYLDNTKAYEGMVIPSPLSIRRSAPFRVSLAGTEPLPAKFDSRADRILPPVRNQGNDGNCWAFAATAVIEAPLYNASPSQQVDYSEAHMAQSLGHTPDDPWSYDVGKNVSGSPLMAWSYYSRWSGPVAESDAPYNSPLSNYSLPVQNHVQNIVLLPAPSDTYLTANESYRNQLKRLVMENAVVSSNFASYSTSYNSAAYSYCYTGVAGTNHAVDIVGWDDSFPASSFKFTPIGDGAWICRNSWGTEYGEQGYFYTSYYDKYIGTEAYAVPKLESTDNYDNIYLYDPLGPISTIHFGANEAWGSNVFKRQGKQEQLEAISVFLTEENTNVKVYADTAMSGGIIKTFSDDEYIAQQTFARPGYYTIKLPQPIDLINETFAVAAKYTNSGTAYMATEVPIAGFSTKATAAPNQGFVRIAGYPWTDITQAGSQYTSLCIKAFTSNTGLPYEISATKDSNSLKTSVNSRHAETSVTQGWIAIAFVNSHHIISSIKTREVSLPLSDWSTDWDDSAAYATVMLLDDLQYIKPLAIKTIAP